MPKEKRVKDTMRPLEDYLKIPADANVRAALGLFQTTRGNRRSQSSLIVIDKMPDGGKRIVGFLSLENIVKGIESFVRDKSSFSSNSAPIFWEGLFTEECNTELEKKVRDLMTPVGITINKNDNLMKAIYIMDCHKLSRVLVVDGQKPVGIIRLKDIFKEITHIALKSD